MKKNKFNILSVLLMLVVYFFGSDYDSEAQEKLLSLIPEPSVVNHGTGSFSLNNQTKVELANWDKETRSVAQYLVDQVKYLTGISLSVDTNAKHAYNSVLLILDNKSMNKESYSLIIKNEGIEINAVTPAGLFYGVQTLLQLLYPAVINDNVIMLACLEIRDEPAFTWRGMHLDVSRHFFSVSFIKKMLDIMAGLKLNTFHWHLTDDQGWRIEIKRYPKLNEVSAWRNETMVGHYTETDQIFDGMRYGGYYTQEEIKEVVDYAQSRFITVVPEIEMPGHAVAALSAYPEFSCTGGPFKVYTKWGVSNDVYCAGKDATFEFLENILDEVIGLFPGQYIHIGGDECPKTRWKICSDCQQRIENEGLRDEYELQSYFIKRIEKHIASKGKRLIGWDEILEGGLPERATVMSWRGYDGGIEAASSGHDVVMTPTSHCYFDYYQDTIEKEPLAIGGYLPLEKVYSFDPVPPSFINERKSHILGAQANVWTEYIADENKVEYMVFPRLCAMAEILWTPKDKQDYSDFLKRLDKEIIRLEKYRVNYRPVKP